MHLEVKEKSSEIHIPSDEDHDLKPWIILNDIQVENDRVHDLSSLTFHIPNNQYWPLMNQISNVYSMTFLFMFTQHISENYTFMKSSIYYAYSYSCDCIPSSSWLSEGAGSKGWPLGMPIREVFERRCSPVVPSPSSPSLSLSWSIQVAFSWSLRRA